jgi:hypothetical protein
MDKIKYDRSHQVEFHKEKMILKHFIDNRYLTRGKHILHLSFHQV